MTTLLTILAALASPLLAAQSPQATDKHAAAPEKVASTWFPAVPGFRIVQGPTEYAPGNLFEYIDGGADAFLQFDFEELQTATYLDARKVEVTVDVYRHKDAERAYGIYTQERPAGSTAIPVGADGYAGADHLEFVTGPFYVKLVQAGAKADFALRSFAQKITDKLGGKRTVPSVLKAFPDDGMVPRAEKFAVHNVLGHTFLHDGVTVPYQRGDLRFRLFAIRAKDPADAQRMVERYHAMAKQPATGVTASGNATLKDPYNGEVLLSWSGRWLWGAVDRPPADTKALVDQLGQRLQANRP
jgi:hypothetical protein